MKLFLIAGKGHTGKNTIANFIKDYYDEIGEKTVIVSLAKYIKMYAMEISNWNGCEENKPRELLQKLGMSVRQELGEDIFLRRVVEDISFYKVNYDNIVMPDLRLPLEIEYLREIYSDTYAIRVNRAIESNLSEEEKNHITEIALDNYNRFDYEILNNDIDVLREEIKKLLEGIDKNE